MINIKYCRFYFFGKKIFFYIFLILYVYIFKVVLIWISRKMCFYLSRVLGEMGYLNLFIWKILFIFYRCLLFKIKF